MSSSRRPTHTHTRTSRRGATRGRLSRASGASDGAQDPATDDPPHEHHQVRDQEINEQRTERHGGRVLPWRGGRDLRREPRVRGRSASEQATRGGTRTSPAPWLPCRSPWRGRGVQPSRRAARRPVRAPPAQALLATPSAQRPHPGSPPSSYRDRAIRRGRRERLPLIGGRGAPSAGLPQLDPIALRIGDPAEATDALHVLGLLGHARSLVP